MTQRKARQERYVSVSLDGALVKNVRQGALRARERRSVCGGCRKSVHIWMGIKIPAILAEFSRAAFRLDRGAAERAMVTLAEKEKTAPTPKRLSDMRSSQAVRNPRLALLTLKMMPETDAMYVSLFLRRILVKNSAIEMAASHSDYVQQHIWISSPLPHFLVRIWTYFSLYARLCQPRS